MKIGIDFSVTKSAGGAYQYYLSFLDVLKEDTENEYTIFNYSPDFPEDAKKHFRVIDLQSSAEAQENSVMSFLRMTGYRVILALHSDILITITLRFFYRSRLRTIADAGVDMMIFPVGAPYASHVSIPYITTIFDLEHRKNPQFCEVSKKGQWVFREYNYSRICRTASAILADSDIGKEDIIAFYHVDPAKVFVLPYLPPNYLRDNLTLDEARAVLESYHLPQQFFFYPAQFWSHKNHMNIVRAIEQLRDAGQDVTMVFSGSKKEEWGEFQKVMAYIDAHQLQDCVRYLGYVSDMEMSALYRTARALVMPTFFGPTNIPVYEAWHMNCPVIYSDIRGCREQLGNAGLLVDPCSPEDIAKKILQLLHDDTLRQNLIAKGKRRLRLWSYADFATALHTVIQFVSTRI